MNVKHPSRLLPRLKQQLSKAGHWLVPKQCIVCHKVINERLNLCCNNCYEKLPFQRHYCQRCGQRLTHNVDFCGKCMANPVSFDACFCPFSYDFPIDQKIREFKYGNRPELAKDLALLFKQELLDQEIELPELLVPVPMHLSRLRQRGFNQSLMLTKALSKLLNVPYNNKLVCKKNASQSQTALSIAARKRNIRGSFKINEAPSVKSIAIVDDVITTGATVEEITKILKQNGVDYVQVWGIAHTI